jgi:hypothetical protein
MAKSRSRKSKGLFRRVYSPIDHLIKATRNIGRSAFKRTGRIVDNGLGFVNNTGSTLAKHGNAAVRNVVSRKNRSSRKNRNSRSRKNRNSRRSNRRN